MSRIDRRIWCGRVTRPRPSTALLVAVFVAACGSSSRRRPDADGDADADVAEDADHARDADEEPLPQTCPEDMVEVPDQRFCIDRYEASIDETGAARSVAGELPASDVTWDRADAACRAAGKIICPREVWYAACSAGGTRTHPYGETYDPAACNGGDDDFGLLPAGSLEGCEGAIPGLFDMTGNVWEWVGPCADLSGRWSCPARGCEWDCQADLMVCDTEWGTPDGSPIQGSGFRCCLRLSDR